MTIFDNMPASMRACFLRALSIIGAVALTGCSDEKIAVYSVPKAAEFVPEQNHPRAPASAPRSPIHDEAAWVLPEGWTEGQSSRSGEKVFAIDLPDGGHVDASLVPFASMQGRETMVVNIWRGQMELDPVDETGLDELTVPVKVGSESAKMFDLVNPSATSPSGERTMVAMLHQGDSTWFFKLNGPSASVETAQPSFLQFLQSVSFKPGSHPPISSGMAAAAPSGGPVASGPAPGTPSWTVPGNWRETPPSRMLLAAFQATNDSGSGQVTVSAFPGSVGGLLANVNRWRGQLGLGPAANEGDLGSQVMPIESLGESVRLISLENQGQGLLAVMVAMPDKTWFYKLTGPVAVLEKEKATLISFVQSAGHEVP